MYSSHRLPQYHPGCDFPIYLHLSIGVHIASFRKCFRSITLCVLLDLALPDTWDYKAPSTAPDFFAKICHGERIMAVPPGFKLRSPRPNSAAYPTAQLVLASVTIYYYYYTHHITTTYILTSCYLNHDEGIIGCLALYALHLYYAYIHEREARYYCSSYFQDERIRGIYA